MEKQQYDAWLQEQQTFAQTMAGTGGSPARVRLAMDGDGARLPAPATLD